MLIPIETPLTPIEIHRDPIEIYINTLATLAVPQVPKKLYQV
jgi:hypothetical protein